MQITQFLVGASYAMAHSFISYAIPSVVSMSETKAPVNASVPVAETPAFFDGLKNLVIGAVSGVSSGASQHVNPAADNVAATGAAATYGQRIVPCIVSSGETFAIWLNVLYLAPLTYLFMQFFVQSYLRRSAQAQKASGSKARRESEITLAEKAGWDAAKALEKEVYRESAANDVAVEDAPAANGRATKARKAKGKN